MPRVKNTLANLTYTFMTTITPGTIFTRKSIAEQFNCPLRRVYDVFCVLTTLGLIYPMDKTHYVRCDNNVYFNYTVNNDFFFCSDNYQ